MRISIDADLAEYITELAKREDRSAHRQVQHIIREYRTTHPVSGVRYELWLTAVDEKKIAVIKEVRAVASLGLKEAKDLTDKVTPQGPQFDPTEGYSSVPHRAAAGQTTVRSSRSKCSNPIIGSIHLVRQPGFKGGGYPDHTIGVSP
jgi:hypothetical protein